MKSLFSVVGRITLVMAIAVMLTLGIGQCARDFIPPVEECARDFIQPVEAAEIEDWNQCNTAVVIANTTEIAYTYRMYWLDHGIKTLHQPLDRCGGGVGPMSFQTTSPEFRLCSGRHVMVWWKHVDNRAEKPTYLEFTVTPNIKQIVVTPTKVFKNIDAFYKPPRKEPV